jgi:hypothetical protein
MLGVSATVRPEPVIFAVMGWPTNAETNDARKVDTNEL